MPEPKPQAVFGKWRLNERYCDAPAVLDERGYEVADISTMAINADWQIKNPGKHWGSYGPASYIERTPEEVKAFAEFIILARNACIAVNPVNPVAAAEALPELLAALKAYELLDDKHANCPECDGETMPELCEACFPLADDARLKMRAAIARAEGR